MNSVPHQVCTSQSKGSSAGLPPCGRHASADSRQPAAARSRKALRPPARSALAFVMKTWTRSTAPGRTGSDPIAAAQGLPSCCSIAWTRSADEQAAGGRAVAPGQGGAEALHRRAGLVLVVARPAPGERQRRASRRGRAEAGRARAMARGCPARAARNLNGRGRRIPSRLVRAPSATPLGPLTTLRLGGPAGRLVDARTEAELVDAVREADAAGEPVLVLAGGSNVVVADAGFPGLSCACAREGVRRGPRRRRVRLGRAGRRAVGRRRRPRRRARAWPASSACRASPARRARRRSRTSAPTGRRSRRRSRPSASTTAPPGRVVELPAAACGFRYRASRFKGTETPRRARRRPSRSRARRVGADPLRRAGPRARRRGPATACRSPTSREAVLRLRRGKGMVVDPADPDSVSAGSFFTNPILDAGGVRGARAPRRERSAPPRAAGLPRARRAREDLRGVAHRAGRASPAGSRAAASASRPSTPSRSSTAATPRRPSSSRWRGRSRRASAPPSASTSSRSPSSSGTRGRRRATA